MKIDRALLSASRQSWLDVGAPRMGPYWLQWVWTLLFCALPAVGFALLGALTYQRNAMQSGAIAVELYLRNLIVCVTIGATIHLVFDALARALGGLQRVRR